MLYSIYTLVYILFIDKIIKKIHPTHSILHNKKNCMCQKKLYLLISLRSNDYCYSNLRPTPPCFQQGPLRILRSRRVRQLVAIVHTTPLNGRAPNASALRSDYRLR